MIFHFIAPLSALRKRTRLAKMASTFISQGARIVFHGWERVAGESQNLKWGAEVSESIILTGGGYSSGHARAMYALWMVAVFIRTLKLGRGKIIFCLGWETAFPALIATKLTGSTIIFDDADRFSLILKLPRPLSSILQRLERWTSRQALIHVVPSFSRYDWKSLNMLPLRNTPRRIDFETASRASRVTSTCKLTIYVNGWIGETRGAPIFLALANQLQARSIPARFIIAGRIDSPAGEELVAHPLVTYHGEIDQVHALALYKHSDIVLTFYDPRIPINLKAESNKWGDCVYFNTPFIVNSEVETARSFIEAHAAFCIGYDDVAGLTRLVSDLVNDRSILCAVSTRLSAFKPEYPVFDDQLRHIVKLIQEHQHAVH